MNTWKLTINFSECPALPEAGTIVSSFRGLNSLLLDAAMSLDENSQGYSKTFIGITHVPSGEVDELRIDLRHPSKSAALPNVVDMLRANALRFHTKSGRQAMQGFWSPEMFAEKAQEAAQWLGYLAAE